MEGWFFMTLLKEYNLIDNKKVIFWMNMAAIPLFLFFTILSISFITIFFRMNDFAFKPIISNQHSSHFSFLFSLIFYLIIIIIHELIHGMLFKLFNPEGRVHFGFKNGMAYATSPNTYYSKNHFMIICLAPFIFITMGLVLLMSLGLITESTFIFVASLHAASCVGDFYWIFLLSRFNGSILVKDTEKGMSVYLKS